MTFKLARLESKTSVRYLWLIWAAVLLMTLIIGIEMMILNIEDYFLVSLINGISWVVYIMLFAILVIGTVGILIIRFYKGLLGDEGYLMHTLPVKTWELITAKGIVAVITSLISIAVGVISILIVLGLNTIPEVGSGIVKDIAGFDHKLSLLAFCIEALLVIIFAVAKAMYQFYAAMAIGQLANRYRILISVGAYVGINIILSTIGTIMMIVVGYNGNSILPLIYSQSDYLIADSVMWIIIVTQIIQLVVFHIVTERILSKKLNLL